MFATSGGKSVETRGRFRLAGLALATAGLVALAPASAHASATVVHSAKSGELAGSRLKLHGVGRHVTWTTNTGRSGVTRITTIHRKLFLPRKRATGTLHIAGHRGGDELTFRLSRPRYNAFRQTVSYRVKRLSKRPLPGSRGTHATAAGVARSFGAASLSVVPHPAVAPGVNGGNDCQLGFQNNTNFGVQPVSSSKWDTDTWGDTDDLAQGNIVNAGRRTNHDFGIWDSDGGLFRGCANHTTWRLVVDPTSASQSAPPSGVTVDFNIEWDWGSTSPQFSCTVSNPRFTCNLRPNEAIYSLEDSDDCRCIDAASASRAAKSGGADPEIRTAPSVRLTTADR
jgi:hypothetical protein